MKNFHVLNAFLLSNPLYRGMAEIIILVGTGICGLLYSWKPFPIFPLSPVSGGILILLAYGFYLRAHKEHKQEGLKNGKFGMAPAAPTRLSISPPYGFQRTLHET